MFDILPIAEKQLYQIFVIEFHFYSEFLSYTLVQILAIQLRTPIFFCVKWKSVIFARRITSASHRKLPVIILLFRTKTKADSRFFGTWLYFVAMATDQTAKVASDVIRSLDQWEARAVRKLDRCFQTMLSCRTMRVYFGRKIGFFIDDRWWVSQKMSADIEGHITEKYEIKKRLGKGVSRGNIVNMLYTQQTTVASLAIVPAD